MEISDEQIEDFKRQIIQQIESTFSEDKKEPAIEKINLMNREEFVEFLQKNKLLNSEQGEQSNEQSEETGERTQGESPFRLIVEGKIPSYQLDENNIAIAVLEINPISKGHTIIIPKIPLLNSNKIPKPILTLANKISKKIKKEFGPKDILISPSHVLGETIINILPIYSNENFNSLRKKASKEELEEIKNILGKKQKAKTISKQRIKKIDESKIWLPRRIP
jgi:histidine triad (HIT) family protein